jgi:outer membrane receptor protein involved in Fe transport
MSAYWFKLSLYRADVSNAIAAVMNAQNFWYQENFKKHRRQGAEFQNKLKIFEGLNFAAAAAFNDIEDRTTRRTVRGGGKARQSFDVGLEYKNKRGLVVSLIGYYNRWNKQTLVYYNQLGEEVSVNPNDRKMLCDLKVSQGYKNLTLFLNVYNLANSKYWADYYFPLRERYFEGGVNFKW